VLYNFFAIDSSFQIRPFRVGLYTKLIKAAYILNDYLLHDTSSDVNDLTVSLRRRHSEYKINVLNHVFEKLSTSDKTQCNLTRSGNSFAKRVRRARIRISLRDVLANRMSNWVLSVGSDKASSRICRNDC
jgi:hypothetical protein